MIDSIIKEIFDEHTSRKGVDTDQLARDLVEKVITILAERDYQFGGHSCTFIDLVKEVRAGTSLASIIEREKKEFHYEFERINTYWIKRITERVQLNLMIMDSLDELEADVSEAFKKKMESYARIGMAGVASAFNVEIKCSKCGTPIFSQVHDCLLPETIHTLEIDFPTGEIVAADWLRDSKGTTSRLSEEAEVFVEVANAAGGVDRYPTRPYDDSALGEYRDVKQAAAVGLVSIFVGNSCPSIYAKGNSIMAWNNDDIPDIESPNGEDDWEYKYDKARESIEAAGWERMDSVCTDLWRVCLTDKGTLREMLRDDYETEEELDEEIDGMRYDVQFDVEPGRYRLTFNALYKRGVEKGPDNAGSFYFRLDRIGDIV